MKNLILSLLLFLPIASADDFAKPRFRPGAVFQSIGVLQDSQGSYCNASMISMSYAITNLHCINSQQRCKESRMSFSFDGNGLSHSYSCLNLVATGHEETDLKYPSGAGDWAIVEIDGEPGVIHGYLEVQKPLNKKQQAEYENTSDKIWRLKYNLAGLIHSELLTVSVPCLSTVKKNGKGNFYHHINPVYKTYPCHVQKGNSGGPILSNKGVLVGLTALFTLKEAAAAGKKTAIGFWMNHFDVTDMKFLAGPSMISIYNQYPGLVDLINEDIF